MPDCCSYDRQFTSKQARASLRRYRKKGLDPLARRMASFLTDAGLEGRSVLEVGGGIGAVQVELIRSGAGHATSVEMSSSYEEVADELLRDEDLEGRVDRLVLDFAESADMVGPADDVIMNRVVCCYPNLPRLLTAALGRTKRFLALTFPRQRGLSRAFLWFANLALWIKRDDFRVFLHSPAEIYQSAADDRLRVAFESQTTLWQLVVFERAA